MSSWTYRWDSTAESRSRRGPLYSRLWTSPLRTAAFQRVSDSTVLCPLLLHMTWLCLCWFYRKHFQAQFMWKARDALISERQSSNVAKIMLCNSRNLCFYLPPLTVILSRLRPRMWGGWWGWFLSPLPAQGWQPCSACSEARGYHYLHLAASDSVPNPQRTAPELPWSSLKCLSPAFLII